ncbi:hypothetical protein E2562_022961 [Oryza meyeriana var. granulata]|uniref:Uncharacterized protein n=1 Tax=Oryza meyeriana var. granulata TaxID=110450 RepID=A0A6G1D6X0_9ORYZ|nr:hypothetical protein E2562_022961 [Oryza meyeriana var. granulata]
MIPSRVGATSRRYKAKAKTITRARRGEVLATVSLEQQKKRSPERRRRRECTAPYIAGVRARYEGRWICGLCGDAVGEELGRASPPISPAEALDRHTCVCGAGRRSTAPPSPAESADDLIAALRLLLRRRLLGSPPPPSRRVWSTPSSPRRDAPAAAAAIVSVETGDGGGAGGALARTESCFAALVE